MILGFVIWAFTIVFAYSLGVMIGTNRAAAAYRKTLDAMWGGKIT